MYLDSETPPLTGSTSGNGAQVVRKVGQVQDYQNQDISAMDLADLAASIVACRFRLPISTARVICELAGIGGLHA